MDILNLSWFAILCYSIKFFTAFTMAGFISAIVPVFLVGIAAFVKGLKDE